MKLIYPLTLVLGCVFISFGQTKKDVVRAEQGDGIFSILRKQGLDPVKYYADFLELNTDSLANGSEIVLGRGYFIPEAPDSIKEMGVLINVDDASEKPIFTEELANFENVGDKLNNAVIYLMASSPQEDEGDVQKVLKEEVLKSVSKELLLNGAKVYLLQGDDSISLAEEKSEKEEVEKVPVESPMAGLEAMRNYVEVINKAFLQNSGKQKYQRLLVIDLKPGVSKEEYHKVTVFHDDNTEDERFADSIRQILNKSNILDDSKDFTAIFAQKNNLFLAKNALPALSFIEIGTSQDPKIEGRIKVKPEKTWLTNVITKGIVNDYVQLETQE